VEEDEDCPCSLVRSIHTAGEALQHAEQFRGDFIPVVECPFRGFLREIILSAREGLDRGLDVHRGPPAFRKQVRSAVVSRGVLVRC
jgi:hypothetical protein